MNNQKEPRGFNKAKQTAKNIAGNGKKIKDLLEKGMEKSNKDGGKISGVLAELQALMRMVKSYAAGSYKDMKKSTFLYAVAAVVYFVNPLDVVPDFILGLGFIDDATVIGFVISRIKKELDAFKNWELLKTKRS